MDALAVSLSGLDYAAVAVFGASGALAAARKKHDIITFGFFAAVTGVGGGTLRDLLIDAPGFWVARPEYLIVCLAAFWNRPPQMGADEDVFHTVDALYTAVTARDPRLVGQCEQRLHAYREADKLPPTAH